MEMVCSLCDAEEYEVCEGRLHTMLFSILCSNFWGISCGGLHHEKYG